MFELITTQHKYQPQWTLGIALRDLRKANNTADSTLKEGARLGLRGTDNVINVDRFVNSHQGKKFQRLVFHA